MIAGVIFDIDGTVLDSMSIWDKAAEMFLNSIGIEAEKGLGKIMFSMTMTNGAEFLKDRYHLNMDIDAIIAGINNTIKDFYFYQVQLKEGVEQFIKEMKQTGIKKLGNFKFFLKKASFEKMFAAANWGHHLLPLYKINTKKAMYIVKWRKR